MKKEDISSAEQEISFIKHYASLLEDMGGISALGKASKNSIYRDSFKYKSNKPSSYSDSDTEPVNDLDIEEFLKENELEE